MGAAAWAPMAGRMIVVVPVVVLTRGSTTVAVPELTKVTGVLEVTLEVIRVAAGVGAMLKIKNDFDTKKCSVYFYSKNDVKRLLPLLSVNRRLRDDWCKLNLHRFHSV